MRAQTVSPMTTAFDSDAHHADFLDRFELEYRAERQPNLLLPSARFTLFALTAIVAGAALAFAT
jgi:hypothetical protein